MTNTNLSVGLVGYGYSGSTFHAPLIQATEGLDLIKVVSSQPAKVKKDLPSVEIVPSIDFLLDDRDIDIVVITTPNMTHYPFAKQAIEAGKHVVLEKPFTNTSEQAQILIKLAEENRVSLTVFHNRRWDADFLTIKDILNIDTLGRINHYEAHFDRYRPSVKNNWKEQDLPGSGILYDLGSHLIDQALVLFGKPQTIIADLGKQRMSAKTCDYFHIIMGYQEKRVILHASNLVKEGASRYQINGERGSFSKNGWDIQENALKKRINPKTTTWGMEPKKNYGKLTVVYNEKETSERIPSLPGAYPSFYEEFYDSLRNRSQPPVRAEEALAVIQIIEACQISHQERRTVDIVQ